MLFLFTNYIQSPPALTSIPPGIAVIIQQNIDCLWNLLLQYFLAYLIIYYCTLCNPKLDCECHSKRPFIGTLLYKLINLWFGWAIDVDRLDFGSIGWWTLAISSSWPGREYKYPHKRQSDVSKYINVMNLSHLSHDKLIIRTQNYFEKGLYFMQM